MPFKSGQFGRVALMLLAACLLAAPQEFQLASLAPIKPSIIRLESRSCGRPDQVSTGFLWTNSDTAVAALHAVAGCESVGVYYEMQKQATTARIIRVDRRADLALLRIAGAPSAPVVQIETQEPALDEQLATLGYALQIPQMTSTRLQLRFGGRKLRDIIPSSVAAALAPVGSPSLDLEVTNIEGHLVHGLSGAPIFNQKRKVVAIADGGLENGAVGISWAIPSKYLNELLNSSESSQIQGRSVSALFSAEADTKDRGAISCGGLPLTRLRTASFAQVSATADDPAGLVRLATYFQVNPVSYRFDVYQHLPSGSTVVLPAGVQLRQNPQGNCMASLDGGKIVINVQVMVLGSAFEAQSRVSAYELSVAEGNPLQWPADPNWTYTMAVPRFDGMVAVRKAFSHMAPVQPVPPYFIPAIQDKYLFETLAFRRNAFLAASGVYSGVNNPQEAVFCRQNPLMPACREVNALANDWVQTSLSIQLSTFPIG